MALSEQELKELLQKHKDEIIDDSLKNLPPDKDLKKMYPVPDDFDTKILKLLSDAADMRKNKKSP
ncbi:hypothetical protein [Anaeromassilibacillus senegalensis]|uniref:hypothetical protein n=1 Tax=Anaeromassilibacillus senegalensis TaxID=1673717 RepID=UPI000682B314|nr:hypothetical protein [Anaeromassilibacillus senegalensis]